MYNDENNLYHYTYSKDNQPGGSTNYYSYSSQSYPPPSPEQPKKAKKNRTIVQNKS